MDVRPTEPGKITPLRAAERRAIGWGAAVVVVGVIPVAWHRPDVSLGLALLGALLIGSATASRALRARGGDGGGGAIKRGWRPFLHTVFTVLVAATLLLIANLVILTVLNDHAKHGNK